MSLNNKASLRARYREIRNNIPSRDEKEKIISNLFLDSDLYRKSSSVFLYYACGSEVCTDKIFHHALSDGKKVAFPYCKDRNGNMDFYFVESFDDLKNGTFGIKEPSINKCQKAFSDEKSICVVPALCFDRQGGRIGYGKGYYDRFISEFTGITVGICFEECVVEKINLDEHDKKVNYLITDNKIYIFNQKEE